MYFLRINLNHAFANAALQQNDGAKSIAVGTPIAIIGEEGDDFSKADAMASEPSEPSEASKPASPPPKEEEPKQEKKEASPNQESETPGGPKEKPVEQGRQPTSGTTSALATPPDQTKYGSGNAGTEGMKAPEKPGQGEKPKFFASPVARKIALERGIPLGEIKGSGPEGRIVKVSGRRMYSEPGSLARPSIADDITGRRGEIQGRIRWWRWFICYCLHPHIRRDHTP